MKLIADSGSTKTDWVLADNKSSWKHYNTVGYNPYFVDTENVYVSLRESLLAMIDVNDVKEIYFYGAGCSTPQRKRTIELALKRAFPNTPNIVVEHDLLGAARAVLRRKPGFVSILGTGTNTCIYDGTAITHNIDSLGYLLGDEGSGAYIGRKIIQNYMRRYFDASLIKQFQEKHLSENEEIFEALYNSLLKNRYLASYAVFAVENKNHPQIQAIVRSCFLDFFTNLVTRYPNYQSYEFNCLGSIGFFFQEILIELVKEHGMKVGKIVQKPIEGLLEYHFS